VNLSPTAREQLTIAHDDKPLEFDPEDGKTPERMHDTRSDPRDSWNGALTASLISIGCNPILPGPV